jgi:CHAD domain-containing protein
MRRVFEQLPGTLVGDQQAVHQMRVAGRRLRVSLSILAPKPASRRVKRALVVLRELVQAAGRGRELDVCLELLKARLRSLGPASPERRLLRGRLAGAIRRSRKRMADAVLDIEIARLRRDLRSVAESGSADAFAVFARLCETRDALGGAVVAGLEVLGNRFDPEALHRLRRQARRLRYAAEVSRALTGHHSDAPAAFKDLQERLGAINDNYVLGDWLSKAAARARARGAAALAAEGGSLAAWFDAQSRRHHRALLACGPVQVVKRALEAMGSAPGDSMRATREPVRPIRRSRIGEPGRSASV